MSGGAERIGKVREPLAGMPTKERAGAVEITWDDSTVGIESSYVKTGKGRKEELSGRGGRVNGTGFGGSGFEVGKLKVAKLELTIRELACSGVRGNKGPKSTDVVTSQANDRQGAVPQRPESGRPCNSDARRRIWVINRLCQNLHSHFLPP